MFLALIIRVVLVALGLGTGRHLSVETFMYYSDSDAPLGVYVGEVLVRIKKTLFFTYFGFSSFTNYLLNCRSPQHFCGYAPCIKWQHFYF